MFWNVVLGGLGVLAGFASWMGWLPRRRRIGYFWGGAHAEWMIMGAGLLVLGPAVVYHLQLVGLLGFAIVVAGFVLGLVSPPWLVPRWYKEQFPG